MWLGSDPGKRELALIKSRWEQPLQVKICQSLREKMEWISEANIYVWWVGVLGVFVFYFLFLMEKKEPKRSQQDTNGWNALHIWDGKLRSAKLKSSFWRKYCGCGFTGVWPAGPATSLRHVFGPGPPLQPPCRKVIFSEAETSRATWNHCSCQKRSPPSHPFIHTQEH